MLESLRKENEYDICLNNGFWLSDDWKRKWIAFAAFYNLEIKA